jgi:hypothetical protein
MRTALIWFGAALGLDAVLVVSYASLPIVQASGGDEGFWAVILFYMLIVAAPVVTAVAFWKLARRFLGRASSH